jgi:hypothetical protein
MLEENDVIAAVCTDLLRKGYAILKNATSPRQDVDLVAREPETGVKVFVSAAGAARSEAGRGKLEESYNEFRLFRCVTRSIHGALRIRGANKFGEGDHIALAFPDAPGCRKYLVAEKPVLDSLGIKVFLVNEDKDVHVL